MDTNTGLFTELSVEQAASVNGGGNFFKKALRWITGPHPFLVPIVQRLLK